jgi:hypothetical protein
MPVEGESQAPSPEQEIPRPVKEVRSVARKMVQEKIAERGDALDNPTTDAEKALAFYKMLQSENPSTGFTGGTDVRLPTLTDIEDDEGNTYTLDSKDYSLAGVYGSPAEGVLEVSFKDKDGNLKLDSQGNRLKVNVERDQVLDAQLLSERTVLEDAFEDDDQRLFLTHVDSLPQNEHPVIPGAGVDDLIDKTAEKYRVPRTADVRALVDALDPTDPKAQTALASLGDKVILSPEEFSDVVDSLGQDLHAHVKAANAVREQLRVELDDLKNNSADATAQAQKQTEFDQAHAKWKAIADVNLLREENPLPTTTEADTKPVTVHEPLGKEIDSQLITLEGIIEKYAKSKDKKELMIAMHAERVRAELALAEKAVGVLGPLKRLEALTNAKDAYANELATEGRIPAGIEAALKDPALLAQVETAKAEVQSMFNLSDEEMKSLDTPGGLDKIFAENEGKEQEVFEKTFGDADKTEIYAMIDDIQNAYKTLDESGWKSKVWEFAKRNKAKRAGILALILLSIPVAVAGLAVAGGVTAISAASSGRR